MAEQGLFGILEVFIDTTVLCSATALSILVAYNGRVPTGIGGMTLICNAYEKYFGSLAPVLLSVATATFAYGSMICWYFYGTECILLSNGSKADKHIFTVAFTVFAVLGASMGGSMIWAASDICFNLLLIVNTLAILKHLKTVKTVTNAYILSPSSNSSDSARTASESDSRGNASAIPHSETDAP